jgi:hypothetical protein
MPATTSLSDCRALAVSVTSAGGTVPAPLQHLLSAAELLMAPGATGAPIRPIVDAALRGELDEKKLDKLIADAAHQVAIANYRKDLRQIAEPVLVEQVHRELENGAADSILDSLRDRFTEHATQISAARDLIPPESDLAAWLSTARPDAVEAWQQLPGHLGVLDRIGRIAASFGARPTAHFPLFVEQGFTENRLVSDVALFCANGNDLAADSAPFLRLGPTGHRASPWFAVPLRLNSTTQAAERYRQWCESEWDKTHYTRTVQHQKPDGSVGEFTLRNPFKPKVTT